jgi:hypothetical protein
MKYTGNIPEYSFLLNKTITGYVIISEASILNSFYNSSTAQICSS